MIGFHEYRNIDLLVVVKNGIPLLDENGTQLPLEYWNEDQRYFRYTNIRTLFVLKQRELSTNIKLLSSGKTTQKQVHTITINVNHVCSI